MTSLRSRWSSVYLAVAFAGSLLTAASASAQSFVQLGGGWTAVAPVPSTVHYSGAWNLQASIGWKVSETVRWRIDALASQFDVRSAVSFPCPSFGCSGPGFSYEHESVNALTANALVNLDPRGLLYVIGGAGIYDVTTQKTTWLVGGSVGAGIALPLGDRLRAVAEARWHGLAGASSGPTWLVPITVGLRY